MKYYILENTVTHSHTLMKCYIILFSLNTFVGFINRTFNIAFFIYPLIKAVF